MPVLASVAQLFGLFASQQHASSASAATTVLLRLEWSKTWAVAEDACVECVWTVDEKGRRVHASSRARVQRVRLCDRGFWKSNLEPHGPCDHHVPWAQERAPA